MAKESFYFSHDYNARNDQKLVRVMMKHGLAGIGLYWCIIEMLYEESGCVMRSECERIAFELRTNQEMIKSIFEDFDLFKSDNEKYWSESVMRRVEHMLSKSKKASESATTRWDKVRNAIAQDSHKYRNAIKEKKRKEIIQKEKKQKGGDVSPVVLVFPWDSEDFKNAWKTWTKYKQDQHGFRYKTNETEQTALNDLLNISNQNETAAREIIQNAIAKGWKGLYVVPDKKNVQNDGRAERIKKIVETAMGNGAR